MTWYFTVDITLIVTNFVLLDLRLFLILFLRYNAMITVLIHKSFIQAFDYFIFWLKLLNALTIFWLIIYIRYNRIQNTYSLVMLKSERRLSWRRFDSLRLEVGSAFRGREPIPKWLFS